MKYKTKKDFEYKKQNKRGGRPMIIPIPTGSIGKKMNEHLVFHSLARKGHNPFVFWCDVFNDVEAI